MSLLKIPTFLNISLEFAIAKTYKRYIAFVLDWIFKSVMIYFLAISLDQFKTIEWIGSWIGYGLIFSYSFWTEAIFKGQTFGKMIMKIKVVSMDGNQPSIGQCAIRWMFLLADAYPFLILLSLHELFAITVWLGPIVGILFIEKSTKKQRLGDRAAGTVVVDVKETYYNIEDTIYSYVSYFKNYKVTYPNVLMLSDRDMTIIKSILERNPSQQKHEQIEKLSTKLKDILKTDVQQTSFEFLRTLLKDFNYLTTENKN